MASGAAAMRSAPRLLSTLLPRGTAVISAVPAHAQTPPRPAVSLQRFPAMGGIPADVDRDGRPDLVAESRSGLGIARGNGDGTFGEPRSLNLQAMPLAVADFNG